MMCAATSDLAGRCRHEAEPESPWCPYHAMLMDADEADLEKLERLLALGRALHQMRMDAEDAARGR